ncbi:hypothetical protein V7S43_008223 [Phytophthora oleae]|uniref:Centrosomal protein of 162 kDa n=1 Tax=Phytophthora oleae TaxID=2107226 RepID=A0ABD3FJN0_9STRA
MDLLTRFLQEDEDSLSPEPARRRSKPVGGYKSSSASSVTAAAAALLASSKLSKSHKRKGSDMKKSKKTSKTQLSDSEEPPPSYYDDYGIGKGGGLENSDADPYAFEITTPAFPISAKEVQDSAEYSGEEYEREREEEYSDEEYEKEKDDSDSDEEYEKEKQKEDFKSSAKNAVAKSAPISMQDRITQILQRTGSQQLQPDKSEEDEVSDEDSDEKIGTPVPQTRNEERTASSEQEEQRTDANYSDSGRSSLSDSLGVGSSDFEVNLPPRPSADRTRLSMSSLDSEKFAVNRDALTSELATPSRYDQRQMTLLKSQLDEGSSGEKDEYEDDEFELDRTLMEENKESPPLYSPVQDEEGEGFSNKEEESFVSEYDKMESLLQVDPVSALTETQAPEARDSPVYSSVSGDSQEKPLDGSVTFGYGEDEFEETERSRFEDETASKTEDQTSGEAAEDEPVAPPDVESTVEYSADYEDDAFEEEAGTQNEVPTTEPLQVITEEKQEAASDPVDQSSKLDALMAKYGDFYTEEDNDELTTNEPSNEPQESQEQTPDPATPDKVSTPLPVPTETPDSPPPPPPPADEDEEDEELQKFMLDAPSNDVKNQAQPVLTQQSVLQPQPLSAVDRFRQIENHVASLRFLQPGPPDLSAANSPSIVHPLPSKVLAGHDTAATIPPPFMEPMSISFDADLFIEDEDAQREIDEFVRSSQIMRQEKQVAAQRASVARENGLVLRLQQAQRQILQLKEHIQTTATDPVQSGGDKDEQGRNGPTNAAYAKLQKEIKTQDALIAAFQKENERLMQQLKQVRQDVHYDVHEANEELRRQVKKLQDQLQETATLGGGSDLTSKAQYRVAVEARLEAEAHAMALQEELASVRLLHQQKLNEVTLELDRVKKAKVELECRYEGVDLTQVAQDTQHARELQTELKLSKKEHAHALAALQKKLDWYVENQRLLDDQDEELRRLRGQITATPEPTPSKNQRVKPEASPARGYRRSPTDIRRIQELEGRLADLEEAMRRRHPDSLANLILASRRADEESKTRALEKDYEEKLVALSRELEQAHEASETKLKSFRQQQEKLLLQYRRKIKEQEKQLKQLTKAPLTHRPASKDQASTTSDAELVKVRRFYTDKIKEVERKWEAKYRSLRKQQYSGLSNNQKEGQKEGLTYADAAVVIANLQRQIREQELELKQEKAKVEQLEAESKDSSTKREIQSNDKELKEQVDDLKTQLEDSESARARLAQTLTTVQTLGLARSLNSNPTQSTEPTLESTVSKQIEAELAQVKQDLTEARETLTRERTTANEKIDRLEKEVADHIEKNAVLEAQLTGNQRELESLRKQALDADRHHRSLEIQAQRVPDLEEEVLALRRELELPRTPSMVQYRSLELQVATLEQKHKLREAELKVVLDRALASTHLEQLSRERAHRAAITAKNGEIASFKRQLEEILDELGQLQLNPPTKKQNQPELDEDTTW